MSPRSLGLAAIAADSDAMTEARIYFHTPAWEALMEWCRFHSIDPHLVLAGTRISRDACNRRIHYVGIVVDEHGRRQFDCDDPDLQSVITAPMTEQGEAPPLPYPPVIAELLEPVRRQA